MSYGFGIIGTGAIAKFHARAIATVDDAKLVSCYDMKAERSAAFASDFGCKSFDNIKDFLADPELQIVTVTTPSGAHMDVALQAMEAGKNVIIEKPLEITTARCDQLIKKAKEKGVMLSGVFQSRFHEAPALVKKAIDEGRFGTISIIEAQVKWYRTQEYYDSIPWHGTWALDGGGALMNQSIHAIDLLSWYGGDVKSISAFCTTLGHERIEVEDTATAVLTFKNGTLGIIAGTTAAYPGFLKRVEVCGTKGSAIIEEESLKFWQFQDERPEDEEIRRKYANCTETGGGAADPNALGIHGHARAFDNVVKALKNGTEPLITGEEARKSVEIIETIYKSAKEKRTIEL